MRWVVLVLLLIAAPLQAQSLRDFPRVSSVSSVTVVEEFLYFDLDALLPQPEFQKWWAEMESCTGIVKPFGGVAWYVADIIYDYIQRREAWGIYYSVPPEIVIVRHQSKLELEDTVKHEILHHFGFRGPNHDEAVFAQCLPGSEHD